MSDNDSRYSPSDRPNVVVFISHDAGRFISPCGQETVDTPNFERLARQSVSLDRCFCVTPLCAPARGALLTGLYPHQNGMMGLPGDTLGGWDLRRKDRHLGSQLRASGYRTLLCGFEHETRDFLTVGIEEGVHGIGKGNNGGAGSVLGSGADIDAWFERNPDAGTDNPFYLQIGCHEIHRQWTKSAKPYSERGVWKAPYLIDDPEVDREMAEMQGAVNVLDQGLGEILDAVERRGFAENTIFVVTTDHGIDFPRAKGTLFDPGIETYCFLRYDAGGWKAGSRSDALVSHVDLYPTILEACGLRVPEETAGKSLLPLLKGESDAPVRDAVYVEKTYHDNYDPMRGLREGRYKYVLNFDAQTLYDVRIATAPRYNWFRFPIKKSNREELYDLESDPHEANNLAADPAHEATRQRLKAKLARWMKATDDPLLDGPIPSPYHLRACAEMKALAGAPEPA